MVNVCEHCLVSNHPKCIVQSYLKWLEDSDYEPSCQLCKKDLSSEEDCVRLLCYHVFHWSCFNRYASEFPPQTAPAGFHCPLTDCKISLFPEANQISPVAEALRRTLRRAVWAQMGLGVDSVEDNSAINIPNEFGDFDSVSNTNETFPSSREIKSTSISMTVGSGKHVLSMENYGAPINSPAIALPQTRMTDRAEAFLPNNFQSRKVIEATSNGVSGRRYEDHDEDKYKRKSPVEMFSRWFKSRAPLRRSRDPRMIYKRWFVLTVLVFFAICTLILIFARLGRGGTNYDPLLDPKQNPNIRVGEGAFSNQANPDAI